MDTVISFLFILTLAPVAPVESSFRAVIERVLGDTRIFTGEEVRLRCSVPDPHGSRWDHQWFHGPEQLVQTGRQLVLWKASVKDSGKYYCRGVRDTAVGNIYTLHSLPVEINVDGGWAILQVPSQPGLVGQTLTFTCRVRGNPPILEMILYRDGVEIMEQSGPHFHLNNLVLGDQGMYSCRASWDQDRLTRSVLSGDAPVQVLEVLTQPLLEIVEHDLRRIRLTCHLQYNAYAPAPPIVYYFYKNEQRLGTATSENNDLVRRSPGHYSCRAKVPQLGISRWSEPTSFGQVAGRSPMPSFLQPIYRRPLAPPVSSPDPLPAATQASLYQSTPGSLPSPAQSVNQTVPPSRSQASLYRSTPGSLPSPAQSVNQTVPPTRIQASLYRSTPGSLPSPAQSVNQTVPPSRIQPVTSSHIDMAEASGDMPEESDNMSPANVTHSQVITNSKQLHK
ncbi:high affinity immunoglobulin gamma Fc receptor I-like [Limanda limanda]|uniref:high affinity immunoglobulin gamma Fc receptor I-like n=1 Tax=Limanda limanda TaxID=27771 RepID=UPI0029C94249|nr:high affinity immunoglobulin gamma Fc receptor I-like [Limanda limanda]